MKALRIVAVLLLLVGGSLHILAAETSADARVNAAAAMDAFHVKDRTTLKSPYGAQRDPFTWLEEPGSAGALAWVRSQNERTLRVLESDPRFSRYYSAALQVASNRNSIAAGDLYSGRLIDGWVHNLWRDDAHPLGVWRRATLQSFLSADPHWDVLLDLDKLSSAEGRRWEFRLALLACLPGPRERCMISLADGGRVDGVMREFDISNRSLVPYGFALPEAISAVIWRDENAIFVVTNAPEKDASRTEPFTAERSSNDLRLWKRGEPLAEADIIFQAGPSARGVMALQYVDVGGERLNVLSSRNLEGRITDWLLDEQGRTQRMTLPPAHLGLELHRGYCITTSLEEWTVAGRTFPAGALVAVSLDGITGPTPRVEALKIPRPREAIYDVASARSGVWVSSSYNVNGRLERFELKDGRWQSHAIDLPDHGTIRVVLSDARNETAFVTYQSLLQPVTLYASVGAAARLRPLRSATPAFDASRLVVDQFEAVSSDGTRIPYFLARARDLKLDGSSPTLLRGYGGFSFPQYPLYMANIGKLWLEQGGTYVLANIRGGGEFGPAWHKAAIRANRQRAYDDFIAVAEDLIRRKITSPRRLGIEGMSNGGLLVGVMLVQRPELFRAAVARVPVLDLLRFDLLRGGAYAANEYGSPEIPAERTFIEQTSPYQNLRARPDFPVPLLMTATNDDNVHPAQARKYVAKMQELGMPAFYYESEEGGHSASLTAAGRAQNDAIEFVYLARALAD